MSNVAARLLFRALSGAMMVPAGDEAPSNQSSAASSRSDLMHLQGQFSNQGSFGQSSADMDDMMLDSNEDEADWSEGEEGEEGEERDDEEDDLEDEDQAAKEAAQQELRKRIMLIQTDSTLSPADKAKKIQELMTSGWSQRQQQRVVQPAKNKLENRRSNFDLVTDADRQPTYFDAANGILGCKHYQRAAKLQAHCCGKWDTCRFCHDEVSDHNIVRNLITTMMCMYCGTVQPAAHDCTNPSCGKRVAKYYCKDCKLWDSDPRKNIYHCNDCGICRIGKGLGIDYFHCKKCNVCMAISLEGRHKCIERNLESDCPICGEYMFTSTTTVIFMPCGHCIHYKCHQEYIQTSYQCPTCLKSLADMTDYFRRIDQALAQQQMPEEYANLVNQIYCNDCEKKSHAKFHFMYHKCAHCLGYNTKVLNTLELHQLPEGAKMAPAVVAGGQAGEAIVIEDEDEEDDEGREEEVGGRQEQVHQEERRRRRSSSFGTRRRSSVRLVPQSSFWCHLCQSETTTTLAGGTMRCETCNSDFIEEC
ncbi:hypothetical protein HK097_005441 [Rhizophlyctis rosea]|uniref:Zf-CHY-domain-containing protein n=1 Tax=Rhizophlyctis rosea TaxID=64517 RepID=A0AAD5SFH9_9FUNG|nr:hypothetical protein HK097_005441 [Rhizophlyctis rosea]